MESKSGLPLDGYWVIAFEGAWTRIDKQNYTILLATWAQPGCQFCTVVDLYGSTTVVNFSRIQSVFFHDVAQAVTARKHQRELERELDRLDPQGAPDYDPDDEVEAWKRDGA